MRRNQGPRIGYSWASVYEILSTDVTRQELYLRPFHILLSVFALAFFHAIPAGAEEEIPETIEITAGVFISGSDAAEREAAYRLDEAAYGHGRTREWGWYDSERKRQEIITARYRITKTLITNAQYRLFVMETGHPAPDVDEDTWVSYGLVHPYDRTRRFAWKGGAPPRRQAESSGGDGLP